MLLVARGFLGEEQLEAALDEQSVSGRRLGEILVERGFIPHSTLSLALAEQYGIHPSVESGFGTGLRGLLARRPDAPPSVEVAPAVVLEEPELPAVTHLEERLEEQWAQLAAVQERLAKTEEQLHDVTRLHERRRAQAGRLLARLRTQRSAQLAAVQEQLAMAEQELHSLRRVHERRHAQAGRLLERLRALQPHDRDEKAGGGHLLFLQFERGYELLERDGGPPATDARLELEDFPDAVFVVTTVGRSPLPNDRRSCVFAQRTFD
jgi:hypothetical protein